VDMYATDLVGINGITRVLLVHAWELLNKIIVNVPPDSNYRQRFPSVLMMSRHTGDPHPNNAT
jgi:hypothetical protein